MGFKDRLLKCHFEDMFCDVPLSPRSRKRRRLSELPDNPMFKKLATSVGAGGMHVSDSQSWAAAAVSEGANAQSTLTWASLGNYGQSNSSIERDLFRWINLKDVIQLEPYIAWLPLELKDEVGIKFVPTPMAMPHEILHSMFSFGIRPKLL